MTHRRSAHSLVELMVAVVIATLTLGSLYLLRFSSQDPGTQGLNAEATISLDLQPRLRQLVVELQEATRIFYPLPGAGDHEGLGFVNVDGESILFYIEKTPDADHVALYRVSINQARREGRGPSAPFIDRIHRFHVNVARAEPGKQASLVNIDLAVQVPGRDKQPVVVDFVTSAFPRNFERYVPDDLFTPGTPLVRMR